MIMVSCVRTKQVEAAKFNLLHERFDLHGFLRPLGQISRVRATAKNIGFQLDISEDTPRFLLTDPGRLRQVRHHFIILMYYFIIRVIKSW
jgi:signal transduction histidine kinase